jgi:hypothetical protein
MDTPLKYPNKGAGNRLRDFYNKLRKPLSPKQKEEWQDILKKSVPANDKVIPKKIAKSDSDMELP